MSKKISIVLFFFLLVITQSSLLPNFFSVRHIPDLALIVLVFFSTRRGFSEVWGMALVAGFLMDIFSFFPLGINTFSFLLVVLAASFLAQRFLVTYSTWRFLTLILLVIAGTALNDFIIVTLMKIFLSLRNAVETGYPLFYSDFWLKIFNNVLVFILIYWPLKKFENLKNVYGQKLTLRNNVR
jgi:rod shape-determining protein MreD